MVAANHPFHSQSPGVSHRSARIRRRWPAWYDLAAQTRRGIRSGAVLGALAPASTLAAGEFSLLSATALVVPLAAAIGGWALSPR